MIVEREFAVPFAALELSDDQLETILLAPQSKKNLRLRGDVNRELFKSEVNALGWVAPIRRGSAGIPREDVDAIADFNQELTGYLKLCRRLNYSDDPPPAPPPGANEWAAEIAVWIADHKPTPGRRLDLWQHSFDPRVVGLFAAAYDLAGENPPISAVHEDLERSGTTVRFMSAVLKEFNAKAKAAVGPFSTEKWLIVEAFSQVVSEPTTLKYRIKRALEQPAQFGALPVAHPVPNSFVSWTKEYRSRLTEPSSKSTPA